MKMIGLAALCAAAFLSASASAETRDISVAHSTIAYDFDGITGTLSIKSYQGKAVPYDLSTILELSCSEEHTKIEFEVWENGLPVTDDLFERNRGWLVVAGMPFISVGSSHSYMAVPLSGITTAAKAAYDQLGSGVAIEAYDQKDAFVPDSSKENIRSLQDALALKPGAVPAFRMKLRGPFVEHAGSKLKQDSEGEVRKKIGSFYQLCSIWWPVR